MQGTKKAWRDTEQAWDGLEKAQCMTCGSKMLSLKLTPLAAAAPELLEAAKALEDAMAPIQFQVPDSITRALTKLRAAIAKAKGE